MGRRANGEGTITRRQDGRYEAAAYVTTVSGLRKRKRVYGRTREEAANKLTALMAQEARGVPVPDRTWKLADYLDYWLEHIAKPNVRATTYAKYESFVRLDLKPGLGKRRLDRLTPTDVRQFLIRKREDGDSPAQLQAMHSILRNALQNAMAEDLVMRNVAKLVKAPTPPRRDVSPWSAAEVRRFLLVARNDPLYAGFVLGMALGLRKGEVLGLGWDDVDLDAKVIRVRWQVQRIQRADGSEGSGKTVLARTEVKTARSRRTIPLPDLCVRVLEERREIQRAERAMCRHPWDDPYNLVFTTLNGTMRDPRHVNRTFERIRAAVGLRKVVVHDSRHGAATMLGAQGVDARTVMEILGHSQIAVTMDIYTHVPNSAKRAAVSHMDELLG